MDLCYHNNEEWDQYFKKTFPYKITIDQEATDKICDLILRLSPGETTWEDFEKIKEKYSRKYYWWFYDEENKTEENMLYRSYICRSNDLVEYSKRFNLTNKVVTKAPEHPRKQYNLYTIIQANLKKYNPL